MVDYPRPTHRNITEELADEWEAQDKKLIEDLKEKYADAVEACRAAIKYVDFRSAQSAGVRWQDANKSIALREDFYEKARAVIEKEDDGN